MKQSGRKGIVAIVCIVLVLALVAAWFATGELRLYFSGQLLLRTGQYEQAEQVFLQLPGYRDADALLQDARYGIACKLQEDGQLSEAARQFADLGDYRDSSERAASCFYELGTKWRLEKQYEKAYESYLSAGEYRDAQTQSQRMLYTLGHEAFLQADYEASESWFSKMEGRQEEYGAEHFLTLADAKPYLMEKFEERVNMVSVHVAQEKDQKFSDGLRNVFPAMYWNIHYYENDQLLTLVAISYYPADKILRAWEQDKTDTLSEAEQQTLQTALEVVEQAKQQSEDPLQIQQYLHDWLCQKITYESPNMEVKRAEYIELRQLSCIGALLDGEANCQGYADGFYLLGNLAGLEVGRQFGDTGGGHVWNTVTYDGVSYITDVTFDDLSDEDYDGWHYTYYNVGLDPEVYEIFGGEELAPELFKGTQPPYSYFAREALTFTSLKEACDQLADHKFDTNAKWSYAMLEGQEITVEELSRTLRRSIQARATRSVSWVQWVMPYGGNTCLVVHWDV